MPDDPEYEREANYFALHLLIPTQMLHEEVRKLGGVDLTEEAQLKKLAKIFGVTPGMIAFRLGEETCAKK